MTLGALSPLVLALSALGVAAVVVALYLLRRTPRHQIVSNIEFWLRAAQRAKPRWLSSKRIPLLALLLTLICALLVVFLAGDPRYGEGVRGTTVIVVSAGQSMGARTERGTRIRRAREETRAWVDRATASGRVAVVRAGIDPSVLVPLTDNAADLDRAFEGFRLDDGPADLAAAVKLADGIVRQSGDTGQILVIADALSETPTYAPQMLIPIGTTAETVAITTFTARRDPIAVGEYAVYCEVHAYTARQATARLVIRDRDVTIFDQPITLGPGETVSRTAQGFSSAQGELTARLEDIEIPGGRDALESDDVAFAVAQPLPRTKVLLVGPGNEMLELLLDVHGLMDVTKVAAGAVPPADQLARFDVVILDRVAPPATLGHPAVLMIGAPDNDLVHAITQLRGPGVTSTLSSHAALDGVRLDRLQIQQARSLDPRGGDQVLVRSGRHALAIAREEGGKRVVALGFALGQTDLVERPAFPLMMHATLHWLAGSRGDTTVLPRRPGETIATGTATAVLGPDDEPIEPHGGAIDDTQRAGIYHIGEAAVAVSATDHAGSLTVATTGMPASLETALPPLAVLVAALLLLAILVEWALLHRGKLE